VKNPIVAKWSERIEHALKEYFSKKDPSCEPLDRAMAYSVLAGGKRIRPLLTFMVYKSINEKNNPTDIIEMTLAIELLHTYSLIHDDLPSMDDDDLRRGKPTNHMVFGEAIAILAGDALHSEAFEILIKTGPKQITAEKRICILGEFCDAIGHRGMVAGQVMDLGAEDQEIDIDHLQLLHRRKTGALIRFSARLGAHLADATESQFSAITAYSEELGLLFQVVDDLLDREASVEELGKTPGKDMEQGKSTFPKLIGMEESRCLADQLYQKAILHIQNSNLNTHLLEELALFVRERAY